MWTREELKYRAKNVLRNCFFAAVVVSLISGILNGGFSSGRGDRHGYEQVQDSYNGIQESEADVIGSAGKMISDNLVGLAEAPHTFLGRILGTGFGLLIFGMGMIVMLLGMALGILVGNPIRVGACRFFMCSRERSVRIGELFFAFRQREFWNVVLIMFVVNVKIFLWSLLFVIPGIVKSYEYYMIPYLLSENPGMSMSEVFLLSREMTDGEKANIFILNLSFLPWQLLSAVTFHLAGIFWVNPYMAATNAELYAVIRERMLQSGRVNAYHLPGFGN